MRTALLYLGLASLAAVAVLVIGAALVGSGDLSGVAAGSGVALVLQVLLFWIVGLMLFPGRPLVLFSVGALARLATIFAMFKLAPLMGLPLAATLLTLVAVFLLTTLLEPLVFQLDPQRAR
jgi:hypothetical protein